MVVLLFLWSCSHLSLPIASAVPRNHPENKVEYEITVSAGAFDRLNTMVSFSPPDKWEDGVYELHEASGEKTYLQVHRGKAVFVLDSLPAGASKVYTVTGSRLAPGDYPLHVGNRFDGNSLEFFSGEGQILSYFREKSELPGEIDSRFERAGYIHPVYTPGGVKVTRHFNPGRPHQYGIWSAYAYTDVNDRSTEFWASYPDKGRIVVDSLQHVWEGPVHGGFRAKHRFIDFSEEAPVTALHEVWETTIYRPSGTQGYTLFDITLVQTTGTVHPVHITQHQYGYGGINVRGHDEWNGEGKMNYTSSEGYGRGEVSFKRVRWSHLWGDIEGEAAGIGIFGHPENDDHPLGVFINETEPFFSYGPIPFRDLVIEPGSPYVLRYRFLVHDGRMGRKEMEQLWNDFAYPPGITVAKIQQEQR